MNNIINFINYTKKKETNMITNTDFFKPGNYPDISKKRKVEIEKVVDHILQEKIGDRCTYVDIISLVKKDDFLVQTSEMDIETTGCLIVNDLKTVMKTNKHRLIVVNKNLKNNNNDENYILKKSRFITAHEYGHFKMHKKENQPIYAHRDTYHRTDPQELEADYFARSILMPYRAFKTFYKAAYDVSNENMSTIIELLSSIFKVSKDKTFKRICDISELQGSI